MAKTAGVNRGLIFLWSVLSALAGALGYLLVELLTQHDLTWAIIGMLGITVVLTPVFYFINIRNARAVAAHTD